MPVYNDPNQRPGYGPGCPPPYMRDDCYDPAAGSYAFQTNQMFADAPEGKNRGTTALLCLFFGTLGVHYFYVGKVTGGIIYLVLTLLSCGLTSILALIQAILLFCMTNQEFRRKYLLSKSTFPF